MGIRKTTEAFINDSIKCHSKKYDYSKVDYNSNRKKVCIICPEYGEFWQTPSSHLQGHCCPECGRKFGIAEKQVLKALREKYEYINKKTNK